MSSRPLTEPGKHAVPPSTGTAPRTQATPTPEAQATPTTEAQSTSGRHLRVDRVDLGVATPVDHGNRGSILRMAVKALLVVLVLVSGITAVSIMLSGSATSNDIGSSLTHTVGRANLTVSVIEQGTLESSNNTEIRCKVRGFSTVTWVIEGGTEVEPGDELVRLDTKLIDEDVSLAKTNVHTARATLERSKANVARAEIAIDAYLAGQYRSLLQSLEKQVAIAETNLQTAQKMQGHSKTMFRRGYVSELEVEGNEFTVTQAELELKVKQTELNVLKKYTKAMQLEMLRGDLIASKSKLQADEAGLSMDQARLVRAEEELGACVVRAERAGMVIYPSAAAWKNTPDIDEGATVRKDQILLLMPDLAHMQVKVGVHESIIDQVKPGLRALVKLPGQIIEADVSSVATVTSPAGWWTGNVVKYDTIIELPATDGLKPGMSAEVEIILAQHDDVMTIPVSTVVEAEEADFCWVRTPMGAERREVHLGDTDNVFIMVHDGLTEGEQVILNPTVFVEEAEKTPLKPYDESYRGDDSGTATIEPLMRERTNASQ